MGGSTRVITLLLLALTSPVRTVADRPDTTTVITRTSTIVVATTTITIQRSTASTSAPAPSKPPSKEEQSFIQDVLNSTNYYRQAYEARPLTWNATLAAFAESHAEQCIWKHSGGPYGENLAAGYATVALGIDAWGDEERTYHWGRQGFSEATGHFTQLVWRNTTSVGCALVQCGNEAPGGARGAYLVCEYAPGGNVEGQYGWNVGKKGIGPGGKLGLGGAGSGRDPRRAIAALAVVYLCWLAFAVL